MASGLCLGLNEPTLACSSTLAPLNVNFEVPLYYAFYIGTPLSVYLPSIQVYSTGWDQKATLVPKPLQPVTGASRV